MCLSGVCQPPIASLGLICGSLIHSRNAVIGIIYTLLSFAAIGYDLLSFLSHGGGDFTHIYSWWMSNAIQSLSSQFGALIGNYKKRNAAMNEFHFWWSAAVECEERPKCASLWGIFQKFLRQRGKLSIPRHAGAAGRRATCDVGGFEGQGNLIWKIQRRWSLHPQVITDIRQAPEDTVLSFQSPQPPSWF